MSVGGVCGHWDEYRLCKCCRCLMLGGGLLVIVSGMYELLDECSLSGGGWCVMMEEVCMNVWALGRVHMEEGWCVV